MRWRLLIPAAGFVVYGVVVHFCGDYSMAGNAAEKVEQAVLGALMPAGSKAVRELGPLGYLGRLNEIGEIHYTWILTTPMFVFMTACGYFSTKLIQSSASAKVRALRVVIFGASLLALGWLLVVCGVRMVKHIFTVSFTAQAMGWSALLLSAAFFVTDVLRFRRGTGLFVLFGQTSLLAYMIGEFFWPCFMFAGDFLTKGLGHVVGKPAQGVVACVTAIVLLVACLVLRRRLK
jgi:predicted acyltransferase